MTESASALFDRACGPVASEASFPRSFDMLGYFHGRTRGTGVFEDRFRTVRLRMAVDTFGQWQGDAFVLSELFRYADGRSLRRDWRIRKAGDGSLRATAADIDGEAVGRFRGNGIAWRYRMNVQMKQRSTMLAFDDRMYLEPDGMVINVNDATKFGFRVGRLMLAFRRLDQAALGAGPQPMARPW
ncbi:MAG: DUF3833 family protein [Alphaproteobacteria bacterium]